MKPKVNIIFRLSLTVVLLLILYSFSYQKNDWIAPLESDKLISPIKNDEKVLAKGKKIYYQICATCHGRSGVGDGPGGKTFNPKPADHTSEKVQSQSDGALFWKITKGRGDMPTYAQLLSKTQRWQVIEYIRKLGEN